jgi:hypothetical protein
MRFGLKRLTGSLPYAFEISLKISVATSIINIQEIINSLIY